MDLMSWRERVAKEPEALKVKYSENKYKKKYDIDREPAIRSNTVRVDTNI